jgi:hypothetical protein
MTIVMVVSLTNTYITTNVKLLVMLVLIHMMNLGPVENVMPDVLLVLMKPIEVVLLVRIHMSTSLILVYNVMIVNPPKDTSVITLTTNVKNVTTTV